MEPGQKQAVNTGQYARVNELNMYYEIHGEGRPLVLIHGGGSTIGSTFGRILPEFAKTHQVIAVELQAHGHTADIDRPLSFEQDADDVAELLKQLGITNTDILGFSNGGSTALQLGIRHPQLIGKLVVASGMYKKEDLYPWFWEGMAKATFADMPQLYKDIYLEITGDPEGLMAMFKRDSRRMQTFESWKDEDIQSIKAPVLVVTADQDVIRPEGATDLFRLLPKGRLAVFPGAHGEYLGEILAMRHGSRVPELFVTMVEEFLFAG
ncbi:alpha/beta fold hydrolase [Pedobacter cryoconitis]|uniref:Pimeloyl-ACP methyl ester carboxylesterase n=1 Tax=Pedobacter cryoconitis TaxID=188932 RepID=A0A7X0IZX0_9SPHI|nr:alpha/beta hydrolase [Pedobacter cryoconitis]MBB6498463.1 pimeloyl-ACP methyl ester carboxylesterase [Pedobacter cryoconitis]